MNKELKLTPEIENTIVTLLENGTPLTRICAKPGSPSLTKVYHWIREDKNFAEKILLARKLAAQTYLDKMIEELETADNKNIMVVREKVQFYKWMASKLIGIYGDKQEIKTDTNIQITWNVAEAEDKSFENEINVTPESSVLTTNK
jgi:hypothetical protein|tara:strand:+ start:1975 stop:2412 length:438 start_codon:yes stop_codon:yes gene_type:complete